MRNALRRHEVEMTVYGVEVINRLLFLLSLLEAGEAVDPAELADAREAAEAVKAFPPSRW